MKVAFAVVPSLACARLVTKRGLRNNTDSEGNFKHPFLRQEHEVDVSAIHYPDIGGFSVKVEKKESKEFNKYSGKIITEHQENPNLNYTNKEGERFKKIGQKALGASRNGGPNYTNWQKNFNNIFYTGPLFMGPNRERVDVIFDTGSAEYVCAVSTCTSCKGEKYDFRDEQRFQGTYIAVPNSDDLHSYGDGTTLKGSRVLDTVCIVDSPEACAHQFKWFAISEATGGLGENESGILGLASGNSNWKEWGSYQLLVPTLYKQGVLSQNQFSWALETKEHPSYLDFGPVDESVMSNPADMVWLNILDDNYWGYFWTNYMTSFTLSNSSEIWDLGPTPAITDSGSSCLVGPSNQIKILETQTLKGVNVDFIDPDWGNIFSCKKYLEAGKLPIMQFKYDGYWFEVVPKDYTLDFGADQCALCLNKSKEDMWILGDVFMRGWYHVHDYENKRQGFVPTKLSGKKPAYKDHQLKTITNSPAVGWTPNFFAKDLVSDYEDAGDIEQEELTPATDPVVITKDEPAPSIPVTDHVGTTEEPVAPTVTTEPVKNSDEAAALPPTTTPAEITGENKADASGWPDWATWLSVGLGSAAAVAGAAVGVGFLE